MMSLVKKNKITLQEDLFDVMKQKELKQNYVAKALGIHESTLSQWLQNNYNADDKNIVIKVEAFIQKEKEKAEIAIEEFNFIDTSIAKTVLGIARKCHISGEMGVIFGDAGLGKTTAIKKYASENPDVIFIKANLTYTANVLFKEIHKKAGLTGHGTLSSVFADDVEKLKGTGRLIIIDEAEHLPYKALDLLHNFYDETGIGLMLVGMPALFYNLCGKKGEYQQLWSRIDHKIPLNLLTDEDVEKIVGSVVQDKDLLGLFKEFCNKNTRTLAKLLKHSLDYAREAKKPLTADIVKSRAKWLCVEMLRR